MGPPPARSRRATWHRTPRPAPSGAPGGWLGSQDDVRVLATSLVPQIRGRVTAEPILAGVPFPHRSHPAHDILGRRIRSWRFTMIPVARLNHAVLYVRDATVAA